HPDAQRRHRLRKAHRRPAPIRIRQHRVAQQVLVRLPGDGHAQLARRREVRLHRLARTVSLREEDLLLGPPRSTPSLHLSLQCPQLTVVEAPRLRLLQLLEHRRRVELRSRGQHLLDLVPHLRERVTARAPRPLHRHLRRQPARGDVPARRLAIHVGLHGGDANPAVLAHLFHQLPHLRVAHGPHTTCLSTPWKAGPGSQRHASKDGAM
ncbi:MAG: hypothetical protein ACK55I_14525, partial [bacterium]